MEEFQSELKWFIIYEKEKNSVGCQLPVCQPYVLHVQGKGPCTVKFKLIRFEHVRVGGAGMGDG